MQHFLTPVLALILWTLVMWTYMYVRRIPAMNKITKNTQAFIEDPALWDKMPKKATWAADNYNHLHEQPVIFYALMFFLFFVDQADSVYGYMAWGYVATRVVHSLVQVTSNAVLIRFTLFALGSLLLIIMALRSAAALV